MIVQLLYLLQVIAMIGSMCKSQVLAYMDEYFKISFDYYVPFDPHVIFLDFISGSEDDNNANDSRSTA